MGDHPLVTPKSPLLGVGVLVVVVLLVEQLPPQGAEARCGLFFVQAKDRRGTVGGDEAPEHAARVP